MPTRCKILFVDDEKNVLDGLRRMLHSMRGEWDVNFVSSGSEALEFLEREPMDVVVSDMRMPGMDGAQFLELVRDRFPHVVRIILSGHSEMHSVMKCVKPAHQFLSKPCSTEELVQVLRRSCCLSSFLANNALRDVLTSLDSLPVLSPIYQELVSEISMENSSLAKIGDIISRDVGMSASLLRLVNSSFFGFVNRISSPAQAVALLGLEVVRGLILSVELFSTLEKSPTSYFNFSYLWDHSLRTANAAKKIAKKSGASSDVVDNSYIAGLLHDVGKLILISELPEIYERIIEKIRSDNSILWEAEKEMLGVSHAEVGAFLLGLWAQPESVVQAVAFHHEPLVVESAEFSALTAVHLANCLDHELIVINPEYCQRHPDADYLVRLNLENKFSAWKEELRAELAEEKADD